MEAVKICSILAAAALLSLLIKGRDSSMAYLIGVTGTVIAGVFAMKSITPLLDYAGNFGSVSSEAIQIVIRSLGIAYITEISASLCRDTGETSLASGVELAGKAEIIAISFPLIRQLAGICTDLLQ